MADHTYNAEPRSGHRNHVHAAIYSDGLAKFLADHAAFKPLAFLDGEPLDDFIARRSAERQAEYAEKAKHRGDPPQWIFRASRLAHWARCSRCRRVTPSR